MQGDGPEWCSHTLDPEQWEREHDEPCRIGGWDDANILKTVDGQRVWHCPHAAIEGHDECIFHLRPEDRPGDADPVAEFLAIINGERDALDGDGRRPPQFVEATFEDLDIERERFGADETIDLRHARIGRMVWVVERVDASIDASGATIEGSCECMSGRTTFDEVNFRNATFDGRAFFLNSVLKESVFTSAVFNDGATFRTDLSEMVFPVSVFQGPADFSGATARAGIDFRITDGDRIVSEDLPTFTDEADFTDASMADCDLGGRPSRTRTSKGQPSATPTLVMSIWKTQISKRQTSGTPSSPRRS